MDAGHLPDIPAGHSEVLHLIGAGSLADFLQFARQNIPGDLNADDAAVYDMDMAEAWRDAAEVYDALSSAEAYPLQAPEVFPLTAEIAEHCNQLLTKPFVQKEFDRVPIALGMVPLAHLISPMLRINVSALPLAAPPSNLKRLPTLSDHTLAEVCLPLDAPTGDVEVMQQDEQGVTFVSKNHELCFLHSRLADGADGSVVPVRGHVQRALSLAVGLPTDIVNVIRFQGRLLLNGGFHRVFALHRLGVTHVPAIIQVCRHPEDLELVGTNNVSKNVTLYFERERPPLLRDFSDNRLTMSFVVKNSRKYVRIRYELETGHILA
jgi:hypothetical protein